jgi:hypothetical protein
MKPAREDFFKSLRSQKEAYVDGLGKWFERARRLPGFFFFTSGTLIILGSVSLPYLVNSSDFPFAWKNTAISIVSLSIALLTALNAFYSWQHSWQKRLRIAGAIDNLVALWEIDMLNASRAESPKAEEDAYATTSQLFNQVYQIITRENEQLFAQIKPPGIDPPG